ncbi:Quinone oxidoreductase [Pleurostoma richardsiae]|uniref:Probable quinone oxidoreductase n=1 Tax=Pleurostoma richardsiae TaxID=41990 RepID=A0AA38RXM6_9PEZI|nr:Quinone oxidoreductase [Pleurostoma richardsiae]
MSFPSTQKAIVVDKEGQVLVKNTVSGINFIDTYFRTGLYPSSKPEVLGREAAGQVVALGPATERYNLKVGDRVVWLGNSGYAEYTATPAAKTVKIPDGLSDETTVASFMSGLTALTLTREAYEVRSGDWVLLHAAAGAAGFLMSQMLKAAGANVIATAGGPEKTAVVRSLGVDHVIDYRSKDGGDWVKAVKEITDGRGVDVVYDSVGKDTWEGALDVVKRKGTIVWFGNASGPIPPLPLNRLSPKCIKIARPTLFGYIATREEFEYYSSELFRLLACGELQVKIHNIYPLAEVQQAHRDLESRRTIGKLLLSLSPDS